MILLVDVGNTRVKWRILNNLLEVTGVGVFQTIDVNLKVLLSRFEFVDLSCVYLSNVASVNLLSFFEVFAKEKQAVLKEFKSRSMMQNVKIQYENINNFGVDRALALVGAYEGDAVMVVDAGSAITADYVSHEGVYLGGYIFPGLTMNRNLLSKGTARVNVSVGLGGSDLGLSSHDCVNNGVVVLFRSLMQGLVSIAKVKRVNKFVITGGDAKLLVQWSAESFIYKENLVLDGLHKYCVSDLSRSVGGGL